MYTSINLFLAFNINKWLQSISLLIFRSGRITYPNIYFLFCVEWVALRLITKKMDRES